MYLWLFAVITLYGVCAKSSPLKTDGKLESFRSLIQKGAEKGQIDSRCVLCICDKESSCDRTIGCKLSPNGLACGAYQILKPYFQECCGFLQMTNCDSNAVWQSCALDFSCATRCVQAYVNHYAPACVGVNYPDCEDYVRVHAGGAMGCNSSKTLPYWNDVKKCYGDFNPYMHPCTTDSDCKNSQHTCLNLQSGFHGSDPNGWFCSCTSNGNCTSNADCCSNVCQISGLCQKGGGSGFTVCKASDGSNLGCAAGCQCVAFNSNGYCLC